MINLLVVNQIQYLLNDVFFKVNYPKIFFCFL